ncbi:protein STRICTOSIDINE SYNTHASE-LIKE 10-like [Gossypium australe]|uniref:Protein STRICTOSIDINE SYNTHASE-LIKE 10-like n=1 Tax=Gossypium australe TaxID=47621 RepID=A0A5B6VF69_9ROSI|nr:protein STRICTOSIDINE SYNTHASE-LIKE 10-like [Gossypium australe]
MELVKMYLVLLVRLMRLIELYISVRKRELCDGSTNPNLEPICGRPLGLKFNPVICDLYFGDAYFGLLMIGPNGGIAQTLVSSIEGIPFKLINGSGRLLKYDLHTKNASVIYTSLMFPKGVALSKNHYFLLVAETIRRRILKFNLGTNNFEPEVFAALPRVPDNIKMDHKGEFWVALNAGRLERSMIMKRELCDGCTNPNFEQICERPLGLKFNLLTSDLCIGDAYFGLLMIGPNGGIVQTLESQGVIYFIDGSITFQRRYADFLSKLVDNSGRLLKYDLHIKNTSVIYTDLMFPNKVALNKNHSFLLLTETTRRRILKFNLGTNNFEPKVFAELPRLPNNIKMKHKGEFWVALDAGRVGEIKNDVPDPIGIKYDQEGRILK